MKGQLALFLNPIMKLDAGQQELCRRDFEMVEARLAQTGHHFRKDLLIASIQMLIIDFFDFHSHLYGVDNIPLQSAANYWIHRYTVLDISRLLRDKSLTFVSISDMFDFSSPAYFSRYVQQHLGVSPTEYRG